MKKAILYTLLGGVFCVGQTPVAHAASDTSTPALIVISELQTGGTSDATEEFVELYNPNLAAVDITGWLLQYRAASGTAAQTWPASTTKATLACPTGSAADCRIVIQPQNRIVITHTLANIAGALPMAGGFSGTGGQIRLVQPGTTPIVHDLLGYGTAAHAESGPAAAPQSGSSLKRIQDTEGTLIDTQNNAADFITGCGAPTPGQADTISIALDTGCHTPVGPTPPADTPSDTNPTPPATMPDTPPADEQPGQGGAPTYLPVIVTEVFADPAPPQSDSTDEFIELYNPNDSALTLKEYRLQTGNEYRYTYILGDTPLGPHMYLAIPSAVSKLSLANSGSGVRLIDPNGTITYEVPSYGDAKEGQSWMQDDTGWKWTLSPTPGTANTLTLPQPKVVATTTTAPKKAAKASTPKAAPLKKPKAPAAPKKTAAPNPPKTQATQVASTASNPQYWLLIPLGTLAAGYAAYEYRHGINRATRAGWAKIRGKEVPPKE